ncbi:MAG: GDP-L-fucose synthase [Bryobacterales bacterium]|nr:GDP-L-fucose synthase [Bryobacterales bacterium]
MLDLTTKRICVTGGGGFLGSFVAGRLRERGCHQIFIPRRRDYDLATGEGVSRLMADARPEVLFHLAAVVGGIGANRDNPGLFFYENAIMGIQLIEAARRAGVEKTIIAGSICSYPKFAPVPFREDDLWNGYPEETNAPYGIAKKALLVQCQGYREQYGMDAIFLMPVNLYGPRDNFDLHTSHVIPALIRKCLEAQAAGGQELRVWGDGSPTREFLYVEDAAEGLIAGAERYSGGDPINLGSGAEISIRDLAGLIARLCGYTGSIVWETDKPNGQPRRRLDVTRAERLMDWRAATGFEEGLRRTIDWYRSHAGL